MSENIKTISIGINFILIVVLGILLVKIPDMKQEIRQELPVKEEINYKKENIVLLGDSITDWYPINDMFDDEMPIIKSGYAGYKTWDIIDRLEEYVYVYNPTKVFILIGTNDLNREDKDKENVIENIIKIIELIKENRPSAKLYLQSIYPVNDKVDKGNKNNAGIRTNEEIRYINKKLKEYCKNSNVEYINMYNLLQNENKELDEKYTMDGLHLSTKGYVKITRELLKYM